MKRITYLVVLMFAMVLTTSCDKSKDSINQDLTLEQKYPELATLNWESTYGTGGLINPTIAPKINITIIDDLVTVACTTYVANRLVYEIQAYSYDKVYRYDEGNAGVLEFQNTNPFRRYEINFSRTGTQNGDIFTIISPTYQYKLKIYR